MAGTFSAFPFGWEVDSGALVPPEVRRQDWRLTSSGVGLNYSPLLPFPPPYALSTIQEPLPPASQKIWRDEVIPRLATTAQLAHCMKTQRELLAQPRYSVAASYQDVHYNKDLREKAVVATTQNNNLAGRPFYICDKTVFQLNEPYLSTTAQDFRIFTQKELQGCTRKQILNLDTYPLIRVPGPMRDLQTFPKATRVPHLILNPAVPHRGLFSLAQETYQLPNDHKRTWDRFCPVQQPPKVSCRVPVVEIMCVPHMYETEYKCYGSGKPMPV
ncbi:PREDICTED: uncharacterized protein LOC106547933 isoform X2 [Thamnophis sirtalis]|uniref:Uncharacterized protein LOC106547933 isoform X2 n=1 Tax=Thamnophis sirtalis TaxID=35019 RepID=A0A6I9XWW6_9SAUR|nr:PREDICTED: uncharacterized protein LOC106547933 isoform X2 [Thamnophis sirtalis]